MAAKGQIKDVSGQRFGRLTAVSPAERSANGRVRWLCVCDCGTEVVVQSNNLQSGNTRSCGCVGREKAAARFAVIGRLPNRQKPDDEIGYTAAHDRVRKLYGSASQYFCIDCLDWAQDWSLQTDSPRARRDAASGLLLSPDPDDYVPRCKRCHFRYDEYGPAVLRGSRPA